MYENEKMCLRNALFMYLRARVEVKNMLLVLIENHSLWLDKISVFLE